MAAQLRAVVDATPDGAARVQALLGLTAIFGDDLVNNEAFVRHVTKAYLLLSEKGAKAAVSTL